MAAQSCENAKDRQRPLLKDVTATQTNGGGSRRPQHPHAQGSASQAPVSVARGLPRTAPESVRKGEKAGTPLPSRPHPQPGQEQPCPGHAAPWDLRFMPMSW